MQMWVAGGKIEWLSWEMVPLPSIVEIARIEKFFEKKKKYEKIS